MGGILNPDAQLGGHSEILDFIAHSGLFGFLIIITFIYFLTKISTYYYKDKSRVRYVVYILSFILAMLNTFLSPQFFFVIFVLPIIAENNERRGKLDEK